MNINSNLSSLRTRDALSKSKSQLSLSIERLSSGLRVNGAKDDAAGQAVANRMTSQIRGLNAAGRNAEDAKSLIRTAESGLDAVNESIQRIRELAIQAANDTLTTEDKLSIQKEVDERLIEIDRVLKGTEFNGVQLLNGGKNIELQVGAGAAASDSITLKTPNLDLKILGIPEYSVTETSKVFVGPPITTIDFNYVAPTGGGTFTLDLANSNGTLNHQLIDGAWVDTPGVDGESMVSRKYRWAHYGVDAIAHKFGVTPDQMTFHQLVCPEDVIDGSGNVLHKEGDFIDNQYVVNVKGDYYAVESGYHRKKAGTNEAIFGITLREYQHPVTVKTITVDPDNLELSLSDPENYALGITYTQPPWQETNFLRSGTFHRPDGSVFIDTYIMIDGRPYRHKIDDDNNPVNLTEFVDPDGNVIEDLPPPYGAQNAGIGGKIYLATVEALDGAMGIIDKHRSELGALYNRLDSAFSLIDTSETDLQAARSRIMDADYALEVSSMTKNQILQQAAQSMLAQANQIPAGVMQLLNA